MSKIPKVYLETTVFNYFFDRDRDGHAATVELFDALERGEFEAYTSIFTRNELENAPEPKRKQMLDMFTNYKIEVLQLNDIVSFLTEIYLDEGVVPRSHPVDASHMAFAASYGMDYTLSFNFQHINKTKVKRMTDEINFRFGLSGVKITTPEGFENENKNI